ncbi:MAG: ribonuclease J [Peptostreptococcaceae bacterium]|nr:ribonuclease J [Peptostreptococcaceae bacterium]
MARKAQNLKVIPLGGLQEIGKNMTAFEYKDEIIVVDCGLIFPEDEMLGIDVVIPDVSYLIKNKDKVKGIVLTHGHEDHIGALPYVLRKVDLPVYGSKLTLGLVDFKLKEHRINASLHVVNPGEKVKLGGFEVEFIRVNHSIPDSCALAIHTTMGTIFHTGDFKVDFTPIDGQIMDFHRIAEIGKKGVLLMLAESTNVERPGHTLSESVVGHSLDGIFAEADARILIATFASNIHRLQQIINAAHKNGRKFAVSGRSMLNVISVATNLGYLDIPEGIYIDLKDINKYDDSEIVIITTGSQGEPLSALTRMAYQEHRQLEIKPGDLVIFSAHPIPGNEKLVSRVINQLFERGAKVIYDTLAEIHVSGHALQEELKLMHRLVRPKFFMPVHGEYRHLKQHMELAKNLGMPEENVFIMSNGAVLEVGQNKAAVSGRVPSGNIMVDGLGVGDVGNIVIRDRKHLSEDGLMVVVVTMSKETGKLLSGPDIVSRGFVYVRESEVLMEDAKDVVKWSLENCEKKHTREWTAIKNAIRDDLRDYLYEKTKRNPMILPIIMEV